MGGCTILCGTVSCVLGWLNDHATAIVALIAIGFTTWQIRVARTHNKLSVRPRLVLWVDGAYTNVVEFAITVTAKNYGLGPAYVKDITYSLRGERIALGDSERLATALGAAFPGRQVAVMPLFDLHGVYAIPKDGELPLVTIEFLDDADFTGVEDIAQVRANAGMSISYSSAYDEQFEERWPVASAAGS